MSVRRLAASISTVMVAIVVALSVPVSQLRTISVVKQCCCPDPSHCHCPDHKTEPSSVPSMKACHNSEVAVVSAELPVFRAPALPAAAPPVAVAIAIAPALPAPHPAPPPPRPAAPS